ncbi:MAG: amidohydrolase [Clostridiaceae bacterium]|nr:amidohydrolase [Clostridiaceae bacterium]
MKPSVLFKKITVVTPDENQIVKTMTEAAVSIINGKIAYCGQDEDEAIRIFAGYPYEICSGQDRILLPAFANTHGHMAMTLLRNQADDYALQPWLFQVIFPRENRLTHDIVACGSRLALAEMIRSGTGAAADMYYFQDAAAEAALDAGFRLNFCVDVKRQDPDGETIVDDQILSDQIRQYSRHPSGLLRVSMLIHSVYLYASDLYPILASLARQMDCPVQVHVSETEQEITDCLAKYHQRPACQLENFGFFATPTIAAHCVHLDDAERAVLARHSVLVAHCPASNLKLGSGVADLPAMIKAGIRLGIGTDGAASNNNLDLYKDMRLASFLAKGANRDAAVMPAADLLTMATSQGMSGLGFSHSGRIAAGMDADLQIVQTDRPEMVPQGNPVSALVYSADGAAVESLMVDGRWLMYKRELQTLDEERLIAEARQAAKILNQ